MAKSRYNFTIEASTLERLKAQAKAAHRPVSNYLESLILARSEITESICYGFEQRQKLRDDRLQQIIAHSDARQRVESIFRQIETARTEMHWLLVRGGSASEKRIVDLKAKVAELEAKREGAVEKLKALEALEDRL